MDTSTTLKLEITENIPDKVKLKKYCVNNNNYLIFKTEPERYCVHLLWGKFDFRVTYEKCDQAKAKSTRRLGFSKNGEYFIVTKLENLFQKVWYTFDHTTEHGFTFEESRWTNGNREEFFEFPKDIQFIAAKISADELGLTALHNN